MIHAELNKDGDVAVALDGSPGKLIFEAGAAVARVATVCGPLLAIRNSTSVEEARAYILGEIQKQAGVRIEGAGS